MRKVSRDAAQAFFDGKRGSFNNTFIAVGDAEVRMYLHGNLIAKRTGNGQLMVTLAGWGTPTTRERVNGLLDYYADRKGWTNRPSFYQRNHCQMVRNTSGYPDKEVSSKDYIYINIQTGFVESVMGK